MLETGSWLTVNGVERSVACEPDTPLLDVLRHDLGLAEPRFGCGMGLCGACLVLIGDHARSSSICRCRPWTARSSRWRGWRLAAGFIRSSRRSSMSRPPSAGIAPLEAAGASCGVPEA